MSKSLALLVVLLAGGAAANSISEQDQIYIVSGVLGGVCLLLTIAAIVSTIAIIKLQTQMAVLQAGANRAIAEPPRPAPPPRPYRGPPPRENYY